MSGAPPLRSPFLVIALILSIAIFSLETGSSLSAIRDSIADMGEGAASLVDALVKGKMPSAAAPGIGSFSDLEGAMGMKPKSMASMSLAALVSLDVLLMATVVFFVLPLIIDRSSVAKIRGPAFAILAVLMILSAITILVKAIVSLIVMIALILSIPFGTIIYMILYASFDTSSASLALHALFVLKVACFVCIIAASGYFVANIGLVFLFGTSVVLQLVINFLYSFPPRFLLSITDRIGAILVSIVAIIWALIAGIGGIVAFAKAVKATVVK